MAANVDLWMRFDDTYQHALSIPVDACQRFAVHPLTWLRYVGFTIYGREGYISLPDGPEVDYYQATIQAGIYHYVSQEPFLLDPDLMDDRTSDASSASISRGDFAQRVAARDGSCVLTGARFKYAEACHVIPHAKGHDYIVNLASHRHESLNPPLQDINDTRNGILLAPQLHKAFGAFEAAFLQTPNFAMTVNYVNLVTQHLAPRVGFIVEPSVADRRLTFQHFVSLSDDTVTELVAPHNSDARRSDSNDWPPPLIFDVAYGCAALKTWGVPTFVSFARQHTRNIYYNDGDNNGDKNGASGGANDGSGGSGGGGNGGPPPPPAGGPSGDSPKQKSQQMIDRDLRAAKRAEYRGVGQQASTTADSEAPDIADMVLSLWMHNARKLQPQARAMKESRTQEKVRTWLDSAE